MKPLQFYRLVVEMRKHQKRYFKLHSYSALMDARKLERMIDAEIERVEQIVMQQEKQGELFMQDDSDNQ
jgi:hypothetical protein